MVRGLDGLFDLRSVPDVALCGFEGPPSGVVSRRFPVAMARGKHLFPFRTEQLSPSAPMVLGPQGPGRVGRRRFSFTNEPSLRGRLVVVVGRMATSAPDGLPSGGVLASGAW